jgi:3-methyladenine DNA glycosylase AlkD
MTAAEIMKQLERLGTEQYRKVMRNHGITDPVFGVKIEELKKIQKKIKKDYELALELFETGNYDAQYLAGLIADEGQMTKKDLQRWLTNANCGAIGGTTVAWVAAESAHGRDLALEWIESKKEDVAQAGWMTLSALVSVRDDSELELAELKKLLSRVTKTIHQQPNDVRRAMNGFVISLGSYVRELTDAAQQAGEKIGPVSVDVGNTCCKIPYAPEYIEKVRQRGTIGKKRKTAKC